MECALVTCVFSRGLDWTRPGVHKQQFDSIVLLATSKWRLSPIRKHGRGQPGQKNRRRFRCVSASSTHGGILPPLLSLFNAAHLDLRVTLCRSQTMLPERQRVAGKF